MRWITMPLLALWIQGCAHNTLTYSEDAVRSYPVPVFSSDTVETMVMDEPLSLVDAIELALRNNPSRVALDAEANWMAARERSRNAARSPEFRFEFGENNGADSSQYGLRIYPRSPWSLNSIDERSEYLARFAETSLLAEEHAIAMQVREGFARLRQQQRLGQHLDQLARIQLERYEYVKDSVTQGEGLLSDEMTARLDLLEAITDRDQADRERRRVLHNLLVVLGLPPGFPEARLDLAESDALRIDTPEDTETLVAIAYDHRADLAAMAWRRKVAEVDLDAARKLRIPWFSHIQASVEDQSSRSRKGNSWSIQTAIEIPIGGGIGANIDRRGAEQLHYAAQMEKAQRMIADEIRYALEAVNASRSTLQHIESKRTPIVERIRKDLEDKAIGGTFRENKRSDLMRRAVLAEKGRLNALGALELASLRLINATGTAVP